MPSEVYVSEVSLTKVQKMPARACESVERPYKCGRRDNFEGLKVENRRKKREKALSFEIGGKFCGKLMRKMWITGGPRKNKLLQKFLSLVLWHEKV